MALSQTVEHFISSEYNVPSGCSGSRETMKSKMEATVHAAMLTAMQKRNRSRMPCGRSLALDNAISLDAAKHKGIVSEVAGDADILLAPDLNTGNVLYKMFSFLGGAEGAAIVTGATVPVVLTSRADPENSKFLSIALGAAMME
jgi:phosphate butyryltransferase